MGEYHKDQERDGEGLIEGRNAVTEAIQAGAPIDKLYFCLLYTSPSPRDRG